MYSNWTFDDYVKQFEKDQSVRFIEPMSAHEIEVDPKIPDDVNHFAELKYDGHRGLIFMGEHNRCFSRRVSKKSGWYSENTDCIPHIRDMSIPALFGTVLDGEFDYGNTSMGVQSVLGSLPENAIAFQEENGYIPFKAFDILYYKGVNVQKLPLWKRKVYLAKVIMEIHEYFAEDGVEYFVFAEMYMNKEQRHRFSQFFTKYTDNGDENDTSDLYLQHFIWERIKVIDSFYKLFIEFTEQELEGIMVKPMDGIYEQKRTKSYLKVKFQSTWDCVVMGYTPATKYYDGKELNTWKYWEKPDGTLEYDEAVTHGTMLVQNGYKPVTKPYFMGWCGAIQFGVWKPFDEQEFIQEHCDDPEYIEYYLDQLVDEGNLVKIDGEDYILTHVGDCKGLSEFELENIKQNGQDLIGTVIEVRANGLIDREKGTLRHPRFEKWRADKDSKQCTWKDHLRIIE